MNKSKTYSSQLLKGTFETIILQLLSEQDQMYGYEISQKAKERSDGAIYLPEGSLYPILHKLEEKGIVTTERVQVGKRTRRYYRLTSEGKKAQTISVKEFEHFVWTMAKLLTLDLAK